MGMTDYAHLIDGLCALCAVPSMPDRYSRCDVDVAGTPFTLMPSPGRAGGIDAMAYFGDVGPLPEHGRETAAVQLLEANLFMVGPGTPFFACNPETGHLLLAGRVPLDWVTAASALEYLKGLAALTARWRLAALSPVGAAAPDAEQAQRRVFANRKAAEALRSRAVT